MLRRKPLLFALPALAALAAPATASADPAAPRTHKTARIVKAHTCAKPAVEVAAGAETKTFSLVDCNGTALPAGIEDLSVLARPGTAPKPKEGAVASHGKGTEVTPGIRRIDPRLVERLETVVEHFRKDGQTPRVELVSGYRPKSTGSFHSTGRALDFKLEGVPNEDVVAFCKTLADTGCGYYPNSSFVHVDAREHGAGHVSWIDISHPGETPHYVKAWPLPSADAPPATPSTSSAPAAADPANDAPAPSLSLPALPAVDAHSGERKPTKFMF
ncbi:MAG: YcbK family protein [Polyangiaceae bacterium]